MVNGISILESTQDLLQKAPLAAAEYNDVINGLNQLIRDTNIAEQREGLCQTDHVLCKLTLCANTGKAVDLDKVCLEQYVRVFKAIVIISRNLAVADPHGAQEILLSESIILWYLHVSEAHILLYEDLKQLYGLVCQYYFNRTRSEVRHNDSSTPKLLSFLLEMNNFVKDSTLIENYALLLSNLCHDDEFVHFLLTSPRSVNFVEDLLLNKIVKENSDILSLQSSEIEDIGLSSTVILLLSIWKQIVMNEAFLNYIASLHSAERTNVFQNTVELTAILITSSETIEPSQIIHLLDWILSLLQEYTKLTEKFFVEEFSSTPMEAKPMYHILLAMLDILASFGQNVQVQEYLVLHGGVETIVHLFSVLERNCLKVHLNRTNIENTTAINAAATVRAKDSFGNTVSDPNLLARRIDGSTILDSNFPGIKCYLAEILGHMADNRPHVQNMIRDIHGLELVLSNCIIDDNNPFIKERCIMCIRYLLANNAENQNFVSKLEAKKAVDDELLKDAGGKVELDGSGNVKLVKN